MRKIWLIILLIAMAQTACEKNEAEPEKRPDERLSETLSSYKTQLIGATYGWKGTLYPEGGAAYTFMFQFLDNDRLRMYSDINAHTAEEALESTYRLEALQNPSLIFDTYSYLHLLADPDASKSGGDWGVGQYSDFEFSFDTVSADTIILIGNYNESRLVLTRATQDEAANYINNSAEAAKEFESINNFNTYFKRLIVGNNSFDISVYIPARRVSFTYYEGALPKTFTTSFYYTPDGLVLLEPFITNNISIYSFNNLQYHAAANKIALKVNNNVTGSIQEADSPIKRDLLAALEFYNVSDSYRISFYGFTIEGVPNALNVTSIPNFNILIYWPKFDTTNGTEADLLGFVIDNSIHYGPTAVPSFTNDGRIIYTFQETLGADNLPEAHESIVKATQEQWTDPEGFYVIKTGESSYDLVSAKDAKSWISFQ